MSKLDELRERERELKQQRDKTREGKKRRRRRRRSSRSGPKPLLLSARFTGAVMVLIATVLAVNTAITLAPRDRVYAARGERVNGLIEERFLEPRSLDLGVVEIERPPRRMMTVSYLSPAGPQKFTSEVSEEVYEEKQIGNRVRVEFVMSEAGMERIVNAAPYDPVGYFLLQAGLGTTGLVLFLFGPAFWRGRYA
ncbi:MAG: hypothetical protein AAGH74_07235 [Pseudomonadota bacterium]